MNNTINLNKKHLPIFTNEDLKDEFVTGIISLLRGEEPKATCDYMEGVFDNLVHGPGQNVIPDIPKFDPTGITKNDLIRYNRVQLGKVPSNGLEHRYKDLKFLPIRNLDKEYLTKLYDDCQVRIRGQKGSAEYRKFIGYLAEVMKHCANSGE